MQLSKSLLIARYSARYSVRGGVGLVFLLLSLTFGLVVANALLSPVEMLMKECDTDGSGEIDFQEFLLMLNRLIHYNTDGG